MNSADFIPLGQVEATLFLTMAQASAVTGISASGLRSQLDAVRAPVLWAATGPEELPEPHVTLPVAWTLASRAGRADVADTVAEVTTIRLALREYLTARPPVYVYDTAVEQGVPYVARAGRRGMEVAHIQISAFQDFQRERNAPIADRIHETIRSALELLGARLMRGGLRDESGVTRGHSWWRLPATMWHVGGVVGG
jgi:hypothetical protein